MDRVMSQIKPRGQAAESVVLEAVKNHGHRWGRAFAHNGLKSSVQNTARALAGFADWKTGRCFPAIKTLAAQTNQSQRTVQNHLRTLEAAGWIQGGLCFRLSAVREQLHGMEKGDPFLFPSEPWIFDSR